MSLITKNKNEDISFWKRLLNFDEFITHHLIKVIYLIGMILILLITVGSGGLTALGSLFVALSSFSFGAILAALFFLIISIVSGALGILLLRVYCELFMVVFKINENLQAIRNRNEKLRIGEDIL